VIVDQRREQIISHTYGVKIARKMQVDVSHRHNLSVAATGRTALHAKTWPETEDR
jgi:hypothetical protein